MRQVAFAFLFFVAAVFGQTEYSSVKIGGMVMDFPSGGLTWLEITPYTPFPESPTYVGTLIVEIIEENPNGSASFFDLESGIPLASPLELPFDGSSDRANIALMDSESEFLIIRAYDPSGRLKPSVPVGVEVLPAGTLATKIYHHGSRRFVAGEDAFVPLQVFPADDHGNAVTDYFGSWFALNVMRARVIGESYDDSSAYLKSIFDPTPVREIELPAVGGVSYIYLSDDEPETVWVEVSDSAGALTPDTIICELVDSGGVMLIAGSMEGVANTVGYPATVLGLSIAPSGEPDLDDDTTVISLEMRDITGTESADFSPPERTLTEGVTAFVLSDSETDSLGVFVKPYMVGGEDLFAPVWTPIVFLPPDKPTRFRYEGPAGIIAGETAPFQILLVNDFGEETPDGGYPYFAQLIGEDPAVAVVNITTGEMYDSYQPFQINSGDEFGITAFVPGEYKIQFADAEELGVFDNGFIKSTRQIDFKVFAVSSYAPSEYRICSPNEFGIFPVGTPIRFEIFTTDPDGAVDTTYSGLVVWNISGSAEIVETTPIEHGRGYVIISDTVQEDVTLSVVGELESPDPMTLHFVESDAESGVPVFAPLEEEPLLAAEEREFVVYIGSLYGVLASWSGTLAVSVEDPNDNGSVICDGTIEIIGGIGRFHFVNSDAETVMITLSGEDLIESSIPVITFARLRMTPNDTTISGTARLRIEAVSADGTPVENINTEIFVSVLEANPDSSCSVYGDFHLVAGVADSVFVEDTEEEWIDIFVNFPEGVPVFIPETEFDPERGWYLGGLHLSPSGIALQKPAELLLEAVYPNPFNSSVQVRVTSPDRERATVEIFSVAGRRICSLPVQLESGTNSISIPLGEGTPSGVYVLVVRVGGRRLTHRIVLER